MVGVRVRGEQIRQYLLEQVDAGASQVPKKAAAHFGISIQAVHVHIRSLIRQGCLIAKGSKKRRAYELAPLDTQLFTMELSVDRDEDLVWRAKIRPLFDSLPENVLDIWHYGFTEMYNNAVDHSEGTRVSIVTYKTALSTRVVLIDNGVGIFRKIKEAMQLSDEAHSVLELAKGKLTTDPSKHSGQGIFFTSRMFDSFAIHSGHVQFSHDFGHQEDWILHHEQVKAEEGTSIFMEINNHTARTSKSVFDQFASSEEDYGFTKTVIPVRMAQYGRDKLVSRSQAKQVLARIEAFKTVLFDFAEVSSVGQAFADEIFRVFAFEHPDLQLIPVNANDEVLQMVKRAQAELRAMQIEVHPKQE